MEKVPTENSFLSYISPDPKYPDVGMVRITNSKIKYIAKSEGFYDLEDVNNVGVITDEERLVVKIMLNHNGTVLLKRERENDKQVIAYFHEDGIVSCENESLELSVFHCFSTVDDLLSYHINDFVSVNYGTPKYPFHFLVPTDDTLYREPHTISYSQKLKRAVFHKLRETDGNNSQRFQEEKYADDVADGAKDLGKVIEAAGDVGKYSDDIVDAVDNAKDIGKAVDVAADVGKTSDIVVDAVDDVTDIGKTADTVTDAGKAVGDIPKKPLSELPENVQESYKKYEDVDWNGNFEGATPGTSSGKKFKNRDGLLPNVDNNGNVITYKEFDVNNLPEGAVSRDGCRFVKGSDGSVYYTDDHYKTFTKLE